MHMAPRQPTDNITQGVGGKNREKREADGTTHRKSEFLLISTPTL